MPRTPRRARQASIGPSAGPASTSTTQPGRAVASTTASPCPTSHATITHPAGGQPGGTSRVGTITTVAPASTASSTARRRRVRATTAMPPSTATMSSAPTGPAGQGRAAPGTAAARSATAMSHAAGHPASQAQALATAGATGATSAASTPNTVAGATAGAASRLAITATGLTSPPNPATIGAVTRKAAAGTASASATSRGTPRAVSARRPPRRQEHERGGGRHRQREPGVDGERGIGEQQHQHGGGERGQRGARAARPERHQRDRSHHGCPYHAGRGPGENHEAHQDRARHRSRQPRIGPEPPEAREHGTGQDRQIRPGHREQMGEPGGAEVVVDLLGEGAGVADGQTGQQPGLGGRERARGGPQARAQPTGGGLPPGRSVDVARCSPHPQHRDREVAALGWGEQTLCRDALTGQQPLPALGGREQQHPAPGVPAPRTGGGGHQLGGHDHPGGGRARLPRGAQGPRIVAQDDPEGRRRAPERLVVQRVRGHQEGVGRDRRSRPRPPCPRRRAGPATDAVGRRARRRRHATSAARDRPGAQAEQHHRPGGGCGRDQPEINGRALGGRAHQTVTRSRSCWNRRSPMPSISRS